LVFFILKEILHYNNKYKVFIKIKKIERRKIKMSCIKVISQESISEILNNPGDFIFDQDIVLVSISSDVEKENPTYIMIGRDEEDGRYYFVVENNEVSEDIYLEEGESLQCKFEKIMQEECNRLNCDDMF
jgi:hypothetical protein